MPAIGLPSYTPALMRSFDSDAVLLKNEIINQVIKGMPAEINFTEKEIDRLYNFSIECKNNSLSKDE